MKEYKEPTELQKMATHHNWVLGFALNPIHIPYPVDRLIPPSQRSLELRTELNGVLIELRKSFHQDWLDQKARLAQKGIVPKASKTHKENQL